MIRKQFPCTRKGDPIEVLRLWRGPFVLAGERTGRQYMTPAHFNGNHIYYRNKKTGQRIMTHANKVILSREDFVRRFIEPKQRKRYKEKIK